MITKTELTQLLNKFIKLKVRYDKTAQTYLINDLSIDEINASYFADIIKEIESKLLYVLKISTNKKEFLAEILEMLWAKIDWYKHNKIYEESFIKEFATTVKEINTGNIPNNEEYDAMDIFKVIVNHEIPNDKELSKLLNVLELQIEYLDELYSAIYELEMEVETINFDELIALNLKKKHYKYRSEM